MNRLRLSMGSLISVLLFLTSQGEAKGVGLWFDVLGREVTFEGSYLTYRHLDRPETGRPLSEQGFQVSGFEFNSKNTRAAVVYVSQLPASIVDHFNLSRKPEFLLVFNWPEGLFASVEIKGVSKTGEILWRKAVPEGHIENWKERRANYIKNQIQKLANEPWIQLVGNSQFAVFESDSLFKKLDQPLRFCFTAFTDLRKEELCTNWLAPSGTEPSEFDLLTAEQNWSTPRVIFNGRKITTDFQIRLSPTDRVEFQSELASGLSYSFDSEVGRLRIMEVYEQDGRRFLVGEGVSPRQDSVYLKKNVRRPFFELIGWIDTIGDFREFWKTEIAEGENKIQVSGRNGGLFEARMQIKKLPKAEDRVFIDEGSPRATYSSRPKVFGQWPEEFEIDSKEESLEKYGQNDFRWNFQADQDQDYNVAKIRVRNKGRESFQYTEIYRGHQGELSARMALALLQGKSVSTMGEFAGHYWFEDVFGWRSPRFSKQRWGVTFRSFQSLAKMKLSDFADGSLKSTTAELRYRLTPGLWGRDETFGFILGDQDMSHGAFNSRMLGAGFFWGRSLPLVFDRIFNVVPIFRYPKWVDMDFAYYAAVMNKGVKANYVPGTWALNFHGKIMWTKSFFGEAGFHWRRYDFLQEKEFSPRVKRQTYSSMLLSGTFGLGFSF